MVTNKNCKVVYITGCLGLIGSHITKECLDLGWYVRGIDKCGYASNENLLEEFSRYGDKFVFEKTDINDISFLYECDYVINTAAETHVGNSIVMSEDFVYSNINGVHNLLELIRNYRAEVTAKPVLLHFSTDEVYGDIESGEHKETDLLHPSNPYSATKAAADQLILAWGRTYDIPYIIVRPTNNYGIGQYPEKLIPKSIKMLELGRKITLHDKGKPVRNWLHAKDTAEAVITIISHGITNQIFNISGGFEQENLKTVECIVRNYDPDIKLDTVLDLEYNRKGQDVRYALNDDKLRHLGWKPKCNFEEEVKLIVEHHRSRFIF